MELQHFSHTHPLIFNEDEWSHESDDHKADCSACGELLSGASFSCVGCGFYLHKQCAEAPVEMDHPFHPKHSFTLLMRIPYTGFDWCWCDFCGKKCEHFIYHCSCKLDLHIKCAFLSYNIAKKELQHIALIDPLISTENHGEELKKAQCFACKKPLLNSEYLSPGSGFHLHAKCVDLPLEINHLLHQKHPLFLQFNNERLPCDVCQKTQPTGFVYYCPPCKFVLDIDCAAIPAEINHPLHHEHPLLLQFNQRLPCGICQLTQRPGFFYYCTMCNFVLHTDCAKIPTKVSLFCHRKHPLFLKINQEPLSCQICDQEIKKECVYCCSICKFFIHFKCASPPTIIQYKKHPHLFQLLKRRVSYICDACGTLGNHVSYTCPKCSIIVHKKCIRLPPTIEFYRHHHPISHNYFLDNDKLEMLECGICRELVKTDYGSYFCSKCNYIVHVNCALVSGFYHEIDANVENKAIYSAAYSRVTDTCINHFSHNHYLQFGEDMKDDKQCDGCLLFISGAYYCCSQCDFFLHESCAELSRWKHMWFHYHRNLLKLSCDGIFKCSICEHETSGFAYGCIVCKESFCLRCALASDIPSCEGHEHPLPYYHKFELLLCNACGVSTEHPYRCKRCNFNLHGKCLRLPLKVQHKSDTHLLRLTYGDKNTYSEYHYCDICEGKRNPDHWFYHCAICDNSVHVECVIGKYSFIKLGSIYTVEDHPHRLTFVQKVQNYPECCKCAKFCDDLALECKEIGCDYIVHWECVKLFSTIKLGTKYSGSKYSEKMQSLGLELPPGVVIPLEVPLVEFYEA